MYGKDWPNVNERKIISKGQGSDGAVRGMSVRI